MLCAVLANEPYRLTLEQIGKLTLYQVGQIYFPPRDRAGRLILPARRGVAYRELFFDVWRRRGLPEWRIVRKWQEREEALDGRNCQHS
ncbi:MAG: hypothetical protein AB7K24_05715 [Gemmataceae bacterium]